MLVVSLNSSYYFSKKHTIIYIYCSSKINYGLDEDFNRFPSVQHACTHGEGLLYRHARLLACHARVLIPIYTHELVVLA